MMAERTELEPVAFANEVQWDQSVAD